MKCPNCSSVNSFSTLDTRANDEDILRRRKCKKCEYVFWTQEILRSRPAQKQTTKLKNEHTKTQPKKKPKLEQSNIKIAPKKLRLKQKKRSGIADEINSLFEEIERHETSEEERQVIDDLGINKKMD
tara:strand:+ start:55 stop:435 length:381 start_codon:yes stop_codon:yes gene_type:complete